MAEAVSVRLTAEGVKEVVDALKRVQREAGAASQGAAGGVDTLTGSLTSLKGLLPAIGFAAATAAIVGLGRAALTAADDAGKAAQRTGTTAEAYSTLAFAAKTADVSDEQLQKGLVKLTGTLSALRKGTSDQTAAFDALGISQEQLAGLDTAGAFALVATKIAAMSDGVRKTTLAGDIFGEKIGAGLIPLLNDLGSRGFAAATEEARKFGVFISTDMAKAAERFNDNITLLQQKQKGLAIAMAEELLPKLNEYIGAVIEAASESGNLTAIWVGLGGLLPLMFGRTDLQDAKNTLRNLEEAIISTRERIAAAEKVQRGTPAGIANQNRVIEDLRAQLAQQQTALAAAQAQVKTLQGAGKGGAGAGGGTEQLDVQKEIAKLAEKLHLDELKNISEVANQRRAMSAGSIAAERALADARAAGNAETLQGQQRIADAERALLETRKAAIKDAFDSETALSREREKGLIKAASAQFGVLTENGIKVVDGIIRRSTDERLAIARTYFGELNKLQDAYLAKARDAQAAIIRGDQSVAEQLKRSAAIQQAIQEAGLTAAEQLEAKRRAAVETESRLQAAALSGNTQAAIQEHEKLINLAKELQAAGLQGADQLIIRADDLLKLAKDASNLKLKQTAAENTAAAADIGKQVQTLQAEINKLQAIKVDVQLGFTSETADTLRKQIQDELDRGQYKINVQAAVSGPFVGGADGGLIQPLASGGRVRGSSPSPRADNIAVMATAGEFMQPVRAVRHYGTDFMEAIRSMELPRFAEGGLIGADPSAGAGGEVQRVDISFSGRRAGRFSGSREDIRALVNGLENLKRATGGDD